MSPEINSLFRTGSSLRRQSILLESIIPSVFQAGISQLLIAKRFSSTRKFWTNFINPWVLIGQEEWRLQCLRSEHIQLVHNLLRCLEDIVVMETSDVSEECRHLAFPRLETLKRAILENQDEIETLLTDRWTIQKPTTREQCDLIISLLSQLSGVVKDTHEDPPPEETRFATPRINSSIAPLLRNLFYTIAQHRCCPCLKHHRAILLLFANRSVPETNDLYDFTMFLSRKPLSKGKMWQEAEVSVKKQEHKSKIRRFFVPNKQVAVDNSLNPQNRPLTRVVDICATIGQTNGRLNLRVDGHYLFQRLETDLCYHETIECISLAEGLFQNEGELSPQVKTCLAVVLSYSLLNFCWGPLFPSGWSTDGIGLIQCNGKLLLRPTLMTSIHQEQNGPAMIEISRELKLLMHGVLLMEIFKQETLDIHISPKGMFNLYELRTKVKREFNGIQWDLSEGYRQCVKACISGSWHQSQYIIEDSEDLFATRLCKTVIKPLEGDFFSRYPKGDPDQILSQIRLPSVKLTTSRPTPKPKPAALMALAGNTLQFSQIALRPGFGNPKLGFFDVDSNHDPRREILALDWLRLLDASRGREIQQKKLSTCTKGKGVKIAVLDTGINLENSWISTKSKRIKCWPSNEACQDTDGHGTHVAYLLLRLAPEAELRIAKISETDSIEENSIQVIAEAIKYFSSEDNNRVDIINLSFGFAKFHTALQPILEAIRLARDRNVLVFAAAGNSGGNEGIAWPAVLSETIAIHATDGLGRAASFSPMGGTQRLICTLGEAVPTCESDVNNGRKAISRSGTSFATPIAVAIASIVLGFIDHAENEQLPDDFKRSNKPKDTKNLQYSHGQLDGFIRLRTAARTRSGMESILCRACCSQTPDRRQEFSYITPWFFLDIEEVSRIGIITNELRSCPE